MKKIDIHTHMPENDPGMENYLKIMDKHNVAAALVHAIPVPGRDNDDILKASKAHPGRIFASVHIDLREPTNKCIEKMNHYADEGFKCIKLFPNLGFDPNEEKFEPFWQAVEDKKLLCLSHCGYISGPFIKPKDRISALTASPFHFEIPVRRHKDIKFIFAHFGGAATYLETIVMITRYENAYADTCPGWGMWVFNHNMPGIEDLDLSHVMFGTDNAGENYSTDEQWWTDKLKSYGRTDEQITNYFNKNAASLLGIPS